MFANLTTDITKVTPLFFVSTHYPGTAVKEHYINYILQPEDFILLDTHSNVWSYCFGPAVRFLDEALNLLDEIEELNHEKIIRNLKRRAKRALSNRTAIDDFGRPKRNFYL